MIARPKQINYNAPAAQAIETLQFRLWLRVGAAVTALS